MKSALLSLIFLETEADTESDSVFCAPRNIVVGLTKNSFLVVNFNFSVTALYFFSSILMKQQHMYITLVQLNPIVNFL